MRAAIAAAAVLGLAAVAAADTIRVPQDQPTIQAGVDAAATGDTVLVARGIYVENVVVTVSGITLKGAGAVLDGNLAGTNGPCLTANNPDLVVVGMAFVNGSNQVVGNAPGLQVLKCRFIESANVTIDATSTGMVLDGCKFYGSAGICVRNVATGTTVRKCLFLRAGNGAVDVTGDGATVESCSFVSIDDNEAIQVLGDGAKVLKNRFSLCDRDCIRITGAYLAEAIIEGNRGDRLSSRLVNITGATAATNAGCIVQKNSASLSDGGINVLGNTCYVLSNRISNCRNTDAISVSGDGVNVSANVISVTWSDADGIQVDSDTVAGGGEVSGNRVTDAAGFGLNLSTVFGFVVVSNATTRCGEDNKGGIFVEGDGNTVERCSTSEGDHIGIEVSGNGNSFTGCRVSRPASVGILVDNGGTGNTFTDCTVAGAGFEGFTNYAANTSLVRGKYQGFRWDIANDVGGGGTFVDPTLDGVTFKTGGSAQPSDF